MNFKTFLLGAAFAVSSAGANAALVTYTDETTFDAAVGSLSAIENFDSATAGLIAQSGATFGGLTVSWENGSGSNMSVFVTDNDYSSFDSEVPAPFSTSQHLGWAEDSEYLNGSGTLGPTITLTFAQAQSAVGFFIYDTDGTDEYLLDVDGVNVAFPLASSFSGSTFFGVQDTTSTFTTLTLTSTSPGGFVETFGIDNISYSEVSEPSTLALLALGLFGAGYRLRKTK